MTPSATRILILGAGKSGTSGLFHCVAQSAEAFFGRPFARRFEPKDQASLESVPPQDAVAKVLGERIVRFPSPGQAVSGFGRQILIVRDPRDMVVSRLLWLVATRMAEADPANAQPFLAALKRKEAEPDSLSLRELYRLAAPIVGFVPDYDARARDLAFLSVTLLERFPCFHLLRYEAFADRTLADTEAYLGFPLLPAFSLPGAATRILRTGGHGGWVNWFLPEDHRFFAEAEAGRMARLGYPLDVSWPQRRRIAPEEGSLYIERVRSMAAAAPKTT
jgi:hypothetical protein